MNSDVEIDSTLERKKYAKLLLTYALHGQTLYWVFGGPVVLFIFFFLLKIKHYLRDSLYYLLAILVIFALYYAGSILYQCYFKKDSKYYFEKRHFTFRDENILVKLPTYEQTATWDAFQSWQKSAGCYVLHRFNGRMIIIPESDILPWEMSYFENLLRQKIDKTETLPRSEETNSP